MGFLDWLRGKKSSDNIKNSGQNAQRPPDGRFFVASERLYPSALEEGLPDFDGFIGLCELSGFSSKQLGFFLAHKDRAYKTFELPKKKGGSRTIDAPCKKLKSIQRWILINILYRAKVSQHAHGFIPGKSIRTNSVQHVKKRIVIGIDIADFFPTITFKRVEGIFRKMGYRPDCARLLADICTYKGRLPQGAPTSPMLSNLAARHMDRRLASFSKRHGLSYSRYADDMTLSGGGRAPFYKKRAINIIRLEGFRVNDEKTRVLGRGGKQKVAGIIVNDRPSIGRKRRRRLRAIVHNIATKGPLGQNRSADPLFRERIFGKLSFAYAVEPEWAGPLIETLKNADWAQYETVYGPARLRELEARSKRRGGGPRATGSGSVVDPGKPVVLTPLTVAEAFSDAPTAADMAKAAPVITEQPQTEQTVTPPSSAPLVTNVTSEPNPPAPASIPGNLEPSPMTPVSMPHPETPIPTPIVTPTPKKQSIAPSIPNKVDEPDRYCPECKSQIHEGSEKCHVCGRKV